ncbi:E3 ubiquitin-protein ligase RNF181 isoform X3 [Peromyscus eremicus]|uniref:E3 ubiquitin-protein ligase RNF181 isoform X3 n=1 Tax=Peromyscus eremicus TaxID=42410 RepID=UPI0027DB6DFB|nr:E3 ubiquitin-protein ligase RNF181 isoform X3 [Peromyscus eremicus]
MGMNSELGLSGHTTTLVFFLCFERVLVCIRNCNSVCRSLFNRMDFEDLGLVDWEHHLPPPAAKAVVESLPRTVIGSSNAELKCPVCLLEFEEEETVIEMPCHHLFHSDCILPWLSKTNSCPLCRHELPTDDDSYEEHKKDKARRQQQQHRLENLHGAMYT